MALGEGLLCEEGTGQVVTLSLRHDGCHLDIVFSSSVQMFGCWITSLHDFMLSLSCLIFRLVRCSNR